MAPGVMRSRINGLLALVCVGSVALGAWLIIWNAAFGTNPLADAMAAQMIAAQNY